LVHSITHHEDQIILFVKAHRAPLSIRVSNEEFIRQTRFFGRIFRDDESWSEGDQEALVGVELDSRFSLLSIASPNLLVRRGAAPIDGPRDLDENIASNVSDGGALACHPGGVVTPLSSEWLIVAIACDPWPCQLPPSRHPPLPYPPLPSRAPPILAPTISARSMATRVRRGRSRLSESQ